jgi:tripartite-type tricarboxylate transporter receptor subunit TctC
VGAKPRCEGTIGTLLAAALLLAASLSGAAAQSADAFYRGRTVTLYIGYAEGGSYDLYCRLVARHLGAHLPGNPTILPRNNPGAGSFKLANELYAALPKDGTALGMIGEVLVVNQILGDANAKFVATEFSWIGRLVDSDTILVTAPGAPVKQFPDARSHEITVGVPGAGSTSFLNLTVVNRLFGTKFKLISGYDGSAQIKLALERGEVDGSGSMLWHVERDWIRGGGYHVVYQAALDSAPDLPDVPTLVSLGRDAAERQLLGLFSAWSLIGRAIVAPPRMPQDRVALLRAALDATVADPAFRSDAAKAGLDLAYLPGEPLAARVRALAELDPALLAKAKQLASSAP